MESWRKQQGEEEEAPVANLLFHRFTDSKERRIQLIQSGHLSDCEFIIGPPDNAGTEDDDNNNSGYSRVRRFACHKMILATGSEVFERMFFGELADSKPIRVDDVEAATFELFLKYIYTYELKSADVSMSSCRELLYLGYKYMMQDLIEACVKLLRLRQIWLLPEILPMYQFACVYDNLPLLLACYERIQTNFQHLLQHSTLLQLSMVQLKRLVVFLAQTERVRVPLLNALEMYGNYHHLREPSEQQEELMSIARLLKLATPLPRSYLFENLY